MTPTEYLSLVYNRHDVCVLCVCTRVLAEVCFDCVLSFLMGYVLQSGVTAHKRVHYYYYYGWLGVKVVFRKKNER